MITQLNPMIPIIHKESGVNGYAFLVIDYSQEHYLMFACSMDNGDIWIYDNRQISFQNNPSLGEKNKTMDIEETLEVFYKQFPYTKATLYEDCIVYNVPNKFCERVCNEANVLIKSQNLLLIAKTNATNSIFVTTVVIEPLK